MGGGQLREGVRNGSNRSHPLGQVCPFVSFLRRLCLSSGGCVFPQGVVSFLYRRLCLCGENFEGDRMNGNTYIFLCCLDREIWWSIQRSIYMNTRIIGLDDEFRSFWIEDFGGMEILWGCGMAKKEEGLCVGESNREWQETAPCNEIQTVAIYSTHFSLQATTGKLQYKNI